MKLIDALCSLPTTLSCNVLRDWIELKDVVFLDSACCSWQRKLLLDLFQSKEFVLENLSLDETNCVQWMLAKHIKAQKASVSAGLDNFTVSSYLQKFGGFLQGVDFDPGSCIHDVYLLVAHCRSLQSLSVEAHDAMIAVRELLRCNPLMHTVQFRTFLETDTALFDRDTFSQIKNLHIIECNETQSFPWRAFATSALETLTLTQLRWLRETNITNLTQYCPNLRWINTTDTPLSDHQLYQLTESCKLLTHLDMTNNVLVTDAGILSVVQNIPLLQHLEIGGCVCLTELSLVHIRARCVHLTGLSVDIPDSRTLVAFNLLVQENKMFVHADLYLPRPHVFSLTEIEATLVLLKNVRSMMLSGQLVKDDALCLVGKHCSRLVQLKMSEAKLQLSSAPLALVKGCPNLKLVVVDDFSYIGACAMPLWKFLRPQVRFALSAEVDTDQFLRLSKQC